jgi:hypothetical protein
MKRRNPRYPDVSARNDVCLGAQRFPRPVRITSTCSRIRPGSSVYGSFHSGASVPLEPGWARPPTIHAETQHPAVDYGPWARSRPNSNRPCHCALTARRRSPRAGGTPRSAGQRLGLARAPGHTARRRTAPRSALFVDAVALCDQVAGKVEHLAQFTITELSEALVPIELDRKLLQVVGQSSWRYSPETLE